MASTPSIGPHVRELVAGRPTFAEDVEENGERGWSRGEMVTVRLRKPVERTRRAAPAGAARARVAVQLRARRRQSHWKASRPCVGTETAQKSTRTSRSEKRTSKRSIPTWTSLRANCSSRRSGQGLIDRNPCLISSKPSGKPEDGPEEICPARWRGVRWGSSKTQAAPSGVVLANST